MSNSLSEGLDLLRILFGAIRLSEVNWIPGQPFDYDGMLFRTSFTRINIASRIVDWTASWLCGTFRWRFHTTTTNRL